MHGAARGHAAFEDLTDLGVEGVHGFVNPARGGSGSAFHGKKGLGNSDDDFFIRVGHHGAVAFDDLELARCGGLYGAVCGLSGGLCWHFDSCGWLLILCCCFHGVHLPYEGLLLMDAELKTAIAGLSLVNNGHLANT